MDSFTTFAPSPETTVLNATAPELDSFASFLEKLARVDVSDAIATQPVAMMDDDAESLSYEHVLRRPAAALSHAPTAIAQTGMVAQRKPFTAIAPEEKLSARTCFRLTVHERDLVRRRAAESSLSVSAYVRSCVMEVEMLRAQVKHLVSEMRTGAAPSVVADETPVIAAPLKQAALPSPTQARPLKPVAAREPQAAPSRHLSPRVQAALEEQRRLSAQQATRTRPRKAEAKPGLFRFFFGARKSA